ncbi:SET and MYND domain-containing protein 4-like [Sitodiplosis mosellana]|uniref:SET and MYND domain-containing protein 4-like n=1 Tax=Sitodiplosis mosellana TaxID=263140 RepID=UPI0024443D15|nr:SET and MYND domain-containing protein 4-like [Sitodiplosis mosellana]
MLWEKESRKEDALYLNMFAISGGSATINEALSGIRIETKDSTWNKNDAVSMQRRTEGNEHFGNGYWNDAMEMYNASLRYAESGSKNISLAYANRSACFLKMKRYNECLIDVELAKEAGYPADLMPKLDRRKEKCLKAIEEGAAEATIMKYEPILSFEPDEHFPCMANVVKIGRDAEGKVGLFAKEDVDVGQTIIKEKAFMAYVYSRYGWKCNVCLKEYGNFVSCSKCTVAMFCSEECRGNSLHDYECGLKFCETYRLNTEHGLTGGHAFELNGLIMRVVRSCLVVIDMFASVDELMNFVEQAIKSDRNQIPTTLSDVKLQYGAFLKLPLKSNFTTLEDDALCVVFEAHKMLLDIPKLKTIFNLKKYRRFLMHLISHHYLVLDVHSNIASSGFSRDSNVPWASSTTGVMVGYLSHSCAPNVLVSTFHGNSVIITVRPVRKGQQIMNSLLLALLTLPKDQRHKMLWLERRMICQCVRCDGVTASLAQCKRMRSDPVYQYLTSKQLNPDDDEAMQTMIDKCKTFLRKYGQLQWSDEIGNIAQVYVTLTYLQYRGLMSSETILETS